MRTVWNLKNLVSLKVFARTACKHRRPSLGTIGSKVTRVLWIEKSANDAVEWKPIKLKRPKGGLLLDRLPDPVSKRSIFGHFRLSSSMNKFELIKSNHSILIDSPDPIPAESFHSADYSQELTIIKSMLRLL